MAISMRAWLALAFLLSALMLAGCTQSPAAEVSTVSTPVSTPTPTPTPTPAPVVAPVVAEPCADSSSVAIHDTCWLNQAKVQKKIQLCDRIYQIDGRDQCILGFVSSDPATCDYLTASSSQDMCFNKVAHALNQSAMCAKLGDAALQRSCYVDLQSPCAVETTPAAVATCEALRKRDPSLCIDDVCRFNYAQTTRTIDACDLIRSDRALALACKATAMANSAYCVADNVSLYADKCYLLTAQALNDSSWCSYGQQGSPYRDDCYVYFATQARDPSICKKVYLETGRDDCYVNYSATLDAPEVCVQVINSINRNKCYIHTALQNGDPAACNGLVGMDRTSCYNLVVTGAVPIRDSAACMAIDNVETWRPICLRDLAVQKKDSTICDLIESASYKSDCKAKLS